jgi:hypothetical protein
MDFYDDDDLLAQWWEQEEVSDDDDYYITAALLTDIEHKRTKRKLCGSVMGRKIIYRDRFAGNLRIVADYFADPPIYNAKLFRRRFRMSRELFLRIVASVEAHDDYFRQRPNAWAFSVPLHCKRCMVQFACLHMIFQPIILMKS